MEHRDIMRPQRNPYAIRDLKQIQYDLTRGVSIPKEKQDEVIEQLSSKFDDNNQQHFMSNHRIENTDSNNQGSKSLQNAATGIFSAAASKLANVSQAQQPFNAITTGFKGLFKKVIDQAQSIVKIEEDQSSAFNNVFDEMKTHFRQENI